MRTDVALAVQSGVIFLSCVAMILFPRLRVWLAIQLCRGTACLVARVGPTVVLHDTAMDLAGYVNRSGGLQDPNPKRIKAYRAILKGSLGLAHLAQLVIAGPYPKQSREETPDAAKEKD
ncbi:hypothetical protein LCGC14_2567580 [marine sediment metagenome]|uniref:Uncharacterized protein n=1 Tax=marine sediment metagenome TaxID=412755 RepID=A0A0F9CUA1_9ZZZZ